MPFLPIVHRELRVASRRGGTWWTRLVAAGLGVVVGGWVMLLFGRHFTDKMGPPIFISVSWAIFVYCLFAGLRATADCLAEEKREGTLGLLFLTDLKGYDIVFGKLAATSLNLLYGVTAVFPVMAIPLLMGGVTVDELGRVALVTLNTLFFSLAVGMFCSALCRDERAALVTALGCALLLTVVWPIVYVAVQETRHVRVAEAYLAPSPGFACVAAFDSQFKSLRTPRLFYWSVGGVHFLAWMLLCAAAWLVPRRWQDKSLSPARRREPRQRPDSGKPARRRAARAAQLDANPFAWLAGRGRFKAWSVWIFLGAAALLWLGGLAFFKSDWVDEGMQVMTGLTLHTILKCWIASEASRRLAHDRQSGALELLLSTPLSVADILQGQLRALARQFGLPLLLVLFVDGLFLLSHRDEPTWVWLWLAGMGMFVLDAAALAVVGMWTGLTQRGSLRAAGQAVNLVLTLPTVLWLAFITFYAVFEHSFTRRWFGSWEYAPGVFWFGLGALADVFFGARAWRRLRTRFRETATQRFAKRGAAESLESRLQPARREAR